MVLMAGRMAVMGGPAIGVTVAAGLGLVAALRVVAIRGRYTWAT